MRLKKLNLTMISFAIFLFTSFTVVGQPKTDLTPEDEYIAKEDPKEIVTDVVDNLEVTVGTDMWDGEDKVAEHVIPIRVTLDNGGEDPIVVRYENFKLENSEGREYSALPLYEVDIKTEKIVADKNISVIPSPLYEQKHYFIYPIYGPVYTGIETTEYDYVLDPVLQEKYIMWDIMDADLPTQEMRMKALTEGVLDRDGIVSGFLFFEDINPTDEKVIFTFDIINAKTGIKKGTVEIPYFVM